MDCLEFRRLYDADPHNGDPKLIEHASGCAHCRRHVERAKQFDALVLDALRIDVPLRDGRAAERVDFRMTRRWIGAAAGLVLALGLGAGLWLGPMNTASNALGAEVIAHIHDEPQALEAGHSALDRSVVRELLAPHRVRIAESIGPVLYARICLFHGKEIPHLVVQSEAGPVTVMVLTDDQTAQTVAIDQDGFSGHIIPLGKGSVAIVGAQQALGFAVEEKIVDAIAWEA